MSLEYNKKLIPRAKAMRRPMTKHEALLWYRFLRTYPLRFPRQKVIGQYIADFYCHEAALVVELDGAQHYREDAKGYDRVRAQFLEAAGLFVLRIPNASVDCDFGGVCAMIDREAKERTACRK